MHAQTKKTQKLSSVEQSIENILNQAQNAFAAGKVDSIMFYYKKAYEIASKNKLPKYQAESYHGLGKLFSALNMADTAIATFKLAAKYREQAKDYIGLNKTLTNIGEIYLRKGMNQEGIENSKLALEAGKKANYDRGIGIAYLQKGNFLYSYGWYSQALESYNLALKYFKKINFEQGVGSCYFSIANIYQKGEKFEQALEYYRMNLALQEKLGNKLEMANTNSNLGAYFGPQTEIENTKLKKSYNPDSSYYYYSKALSLYEEVGAVYQIVKTLTNLSFYYSHIKQFDKAKNSIERAEKIVKDNKLTDLEGVIFQYKALYFYIKGDYPQAIIYFKKAIPVYEAQNLTDEQMMLHKFLARAYHLQGDYKSAFETFYLYDKLQDSIRKEDYDDNLAQLGYYKKEADNKMLAQTNQAKEEQNKVLQEKNTAQARFNLLLKIGLGLIGIFLLFVFYLFILKRKANKLLVLRNEEILQQKEEIETQRNQVLSQKNIIEEQQHNILDSIHYACRIQEAILPQHDTIHELFDDKLFVLFKPRDIVSGDFYWLGKKGNKKIVAAADCTGHGVPGAFMSMLGTAFINEIIGSADYNLKSSDVLNQLREYIIESLKQTGKSGEQKDGMDISMYIYDEQSMILNFAGANNPLIILRKKSESIDFVETDRIKIQDFVSEIDSVEYNVIHISGDKMPIGIYSEQKPFECIDLQLKKGDVIYSFSDGYQDQFGGDKNKKFMIKRLKQLFVDMNSLSMDKQAEVLDRTIQEWIKDGNTEQIDDILVIGLQL